MLFARLPRRLGRVKRRRLGFSVEGGDIWQIDRWISYGGLTARAVARTHSNDCVPSCVAGHRASASTTILFAGRVPCKGVRAYGSFQVVRTTNPSVAEAGEIRDLMHLCGVRGVRAFAAMFVS